MPVHVEDQTPPPSETPVYRATSVEPESSRIIKTTLETDPVVDARSGVGSVTLEPFVGEVIETETSDTTTVTLSVPVLPSAS